MAQTRWILTFFLIDLAKGSTQIRIVRWFERSVISNIFLQWYGIIGVLEMIPSPTFTITIKRYKKSQCREISQKSHCTGWSLEYRKLIQSIQCCDKSICSCTIYLNKFKGGDDVKHSPTPRYMKCLNWGRT